MLPTPNIVTCVRAGIAWLHAHTPHPCCARVHTNLCSLCQLRHAGIGLQGASFSGNASMPVDANGTLLHFRGARILQAIVANITAPVAAGGKGMSVALSDAGILSGCR